MSNSLINRRHLIGSALLPIAVGLTNTASDPVAAQTGRDSRSAVVFLSRSGNTRVIAGALSRRYRSDVFEVRPRDPWPEDYDEMVRWAVRMRERPEPLPLAETFDLSRYATVFIGFPIWGSQLPVPMRSFFTSHDLRGKTVLPFITHGGFGPGSSMDAVRGLVATARTARPFVLRCDQERDTLSRLGDWLGSVRSDLPS